jgi:hypothetical protein
MMMSVLTLSPNLTHLPPIVSVMAASFRSAVL